MVSLTNKKKATKKNQSQKQSGKTTLNWLRKAGFEIGDYTTILVSEGVLVIWKEENTDVEM
jgi:hypothetical protein